MVSVKRLAMLAVTGFISVTASASNWVQVAQSNDAVFYIDTDSLINSGSYKQVFSKRVHHDVKTSSSIKYDTAVQLDQIDCKSQPRRLRALSVIFRLNDEVAFSIDSPSEWVIAYPDTTGEEIAKYLCSH